MYQPLQSHHGDSIGFSNRDEAAAAERDELIRKLGLHELTAALGSLRYGTASRRIVARLLYCDMIYSGTVLYGISVLSICLSICHPAEHNRDLACNHSLGAPSIVLLCRRIFSSFSEHFQSGNIFHISARSPFRFRSLHKHCLHFLCYHSTRRG